MAPRMKPGMTPWPAIAGPAPLARRPVQRVSESVFQRQIPPFALRISYFVDGLTDDLSTAMVKRIQNRYDVEIWPWELRQMAARRTPDNTRS